MGKLGRRLLRVATGVVVLVVGSFLCVCAGMIFPVQIAFYLVFGWAIFLYRVGSSIDPDPATVATSIACLAGVTVGTHLFAQWLYAATGDGQPARQWPWRWTVRLVAVVVLLFAAGTAAVGIVHQTGWLIRSPEPLLGGGMRHVAIRIKSQNNLKEIGLAIHNHEDAKGRLPASTFTPDGRPLHSWQTAILPFIEKEDLYRRINLDRPWTHPDNAGPMSELVKPYLHPAVEQDRVGGFAASHYAANVLTLGGDRKRTLQGFPEGASYTVLAAEATTKPRAWGDLLNWRDPRLGINAHPDGFNGPSRGGINILMADGSVRFVSDKQAKGLLDGKFDDN